MLWAVRSFPKMPYAVEWFLMNASVWVIFLLAGEQRRAIRFNLKHIHDDISLAEGYWWTFCVFRNFGWTYLDSMRARMGQKSITWELDGEEVFNEIRNSNESAILFTTHTGNYDLAACLFASEFGRILHTVRVPERTEKLQKLREREFEADMERYPFFRTHYNKPGNMLGVELARLLSEGELLALQCDRVIGDVVEMDIPLHGENEEESEWLMRIPKGPMTLASFAKCPCYPLYVVRDRHRHYRVIFKPALKLDSSRRRPREIDYANPWVAGLREFLVHHSQQWFVFEKAFIQNDDC